MIVCAALLAMLLTVGKRRGDLAQNNDQFVKRRSLSKYTVPYLDHLLSILAAGTLVTYLMFSMSDYAAARFGSHVILSSVLSCSE